MPALYASGKGLIEQQPVSDASNAESIDKNSAKQQKNKCSTQTITMARFRVEVFPRRVNQRVFAATAGSAGTVNDNEAGDQNAGAFSVQVMISAVILIFSMAMLIAGRDENVYLPLVAVGARGALPLDPVVPETLIGTCERPRPPNATCQHRTYHGSIHLSDRPCMSCYPP